MEKRNLEHLFGENVWEDLVSDFLEMACFLKPEDHTYLIEELQRQNVKAESIDVHPCFSINGKVIIVCEEIVPRECWLFFAKRRQVTRWVETAQRFQKKEPV